MLSIFKIVTFFVIRLRYYDMTSWGGIFRLEQL
jgi:hypothetical protein